jgi:hypothetical protein
MLRNILHLLGPAAVVHAECLNASGGRNVFKPGLDYLQQSASRSLLQREFNHRRRLALLRDDFHDQEFIPGIRDISLRRLSDNERILQIDLKPLPELFVIGQCPPDPLDRRVDFDLFLNFVHLHGLQERY